VYRSITLKQIWVVSAVVLGTLDLLFALTVHLRVWQTLDWACLAALQAALPRAVDLPFSVLSLLGSAEATGLIMLAFVFRARSAQRLPLLLGFGLATVLELIGKTIINQPTTPNDLLRYVSLFPILSAEVNPGFSFPSGHAMRMTFIVIVLADLTTASRLRRATKGWLYALLIVLEGVMLVSRVYLAEHWLTDVIGGALLGAVGALGALSTRQD
jgi:membrane-associated phospholipid phosphatase